MQRNKKEPEPNLLPIIVFIIGLLWMLVSGWETVTHHDIEILGVIGMFLMIGTAFIIWITSKDGKPNK